MSKRENIIIQEDEIKKQNEYMEAVRKENEKKYELTGARSKAFAVTYGCQQNENDTERLKGMISKMGYDFTLKKDEADLILYNTCAVRENAELKVVGNVGALRVLKQKKPHVLIGVCGCMMQQEHVVKFITKHFKHVDMIFGTHTLHKFPEILSAARENRIIDIMDVDGFITEDMPVKREGFVKAYVSIMYGCNNFCTYCIVPFVRGRERSRDSDKIIEEVSLLAKEGYKEITLLGQNVNSYGNDLENKAETFAQLLRQINEVEGIERIRFATSHPKDISDELILAMKECRKVCRQLHLPFQAGSNKVLGLMNRNYTKETYLKTIQKVKAEMPGIALSSDIIVGFPGETNEDFKQTMEVVKEAAFDSLYTFIYSKRRGTKAEKMEDVLTSEEKKANFDKLLSVQQEISRKINETYLGKKFDVLVEGYSKTNEEMLTGRTESNKVVNFEGDKTLIGRMVLVKITDVKTWSLNGEIV